MARYSFDVPDLVDGINFVVVAMGIFGLGEIIGNLEDESERSLVVKKVTGLMLNKEEFKAIAAPAVQRHARLDSRHPTRRWGDAFVFAAYALEKKVSKNKANFGKGNAEGRYLASPTATTPVL